MGNVFLQLNSDAQQLVAGFESGERTEVIVYLPVGGLSRIGVEIGTPEWYPELEILSVRMYLTYNSTDKAKENWKKKGFSEDWLPV
jgi:hypothetical protein